MSKVLIGNLPHCRKIVRVPYPSSVRLFIEKSTQIPEKFFESEATLNKQIAGKQFKARAQCRLHPFSHCILSMKE